MARKPRMPRLPALVSRTRAAEMLGVAKSNVGRYDDKLGQFEVAVEGARAPVYVKAGIEWLAETLNGAG